MKPTTNIATNNAKNLKLKLQIPNFQFPISNSIPKPHPQPIFDRNKIYTPLQRLLCQLTKEAMTLDVTMTARQNDELKQTVHRERKRLLDFIRQRVPTEEDAEDILQDVFYQLTNAYRSMEPIEKVTSWLFTVARNRITDFFRKKKPDSFSSLSRPASGDESDDDQNYFLEEIMQDVSDSPEGEYIRSLVWETLNAALEELPEEQRKIFTLHELDGVSFKEMSEQMKLPLNTLLSRKRYAVLHLRKRLQSLYDELLEL